MKSSPMQEALRRNKSKSLDITILFDAPEGTSVDVAPGDDAGANSDRDEKELGLAPNATPVGEAEQVEQQELEPSAEMMAPAAPMVHEDEAADRALIQNELDSRMGRGSMAQKSAARRPMLKK